MNDTLSLQALFNNRIFRVPDYQRGYAWEEQQVGEFLDDLALLDSFAGITPAQLSSTNRLTPKRLTITREHITSKSTSWMDNND